MRRILPFVMVGVLTSCGSTASPTTTAPPSPTSPATTAAPVITTAPSTTGQPATTPAPEESNLIEIEVSGSTVAGGGKVTIPLGEEATIRVESDSADEVHLHGYDLFAELQPNVPADIVFVASIPGVFELELEESGLLLAEIEVS